MSELKNLSKEINLSKIKIHNYKWKRSQYQNSSKERNDWHIRLEGEHKRFHLLVKHYKELKAATLSFDEIMDKAIKRLHPHVEKPNGTELHLLSAKKRLKHTKRHNQTKHKRERTKPHYGVGR